MDVTWREQAGAMQAHAQTPTGSPQQLLYFVTCPMCVETGLMVLRRAVESRDVETGCLNSS